MEEANTSDAPTVRSVGVKYGLIASAVNIVFFLVLVLMGLGAFDNKWNWIGIIFGIVILVLAQKNFKDEGDGYMTYGQGFGIGFWITVVSLVVGGAFTFVYSNFIDTNVMESFYRNQREQMEASGTPEQSIEIAQEWTRKLFWVFYFVFGFIFSLIVPLIVTIFTQKKSQQADVV